MVRVCAHICIFLCFFVIKDTFFVSSFCHFSRTKTTPLYHFQPINSRFTPVTAVFQTHRLSLIASGRTYLFLRAFSFMPVVGNLVVDQDKRASWFSHKAEIAKPYYYKVYLADHDVTTEIAPTERAAQFRFTFPESDSSYVLLDAFDKGSYVKVIPQERTIIGYCRNHRAGVPENFHNYFIAVFDKDFEEVSTWNGWKVQKGSTENKGKHVGAVVRFKTSRGEQVNVRVASSFISPEQAKLNLKRELGDDSFDKTRQKAKDIWNRQLGRIEVTGGTLAQYQNFYTAFYRSLLFPRMFHEIDKDGKIVHYSPYNGKVLPGYMYTDNGFWDTFRAAFPLNALMYPKQNAQMMEGLANTFKESGWLPNQIRTGALLVRMHRIRCQRNDNQAWPF